MKKLIRVLFIILCTHLSVQAQDSLNELLNLSIEKLMDIPIYSASKTEETIFDAPLSSSVLTKEQIRNSGATSIMEALRLVPGVIVREQTNGNYDIHIRGLDNVPPNSNLVFFTNSTTLVMIDNRPVYNYLHGGTFWETLPITLHDVERIEVVRGPSAAIYGPNAVSGVINIITRKIEKDGPYATGQAQYGSYNSLISGAAVGYKKDKFSAIVSGNFLRKDRTQSDYYDVTRDAYVPLDSVTAVLRNPRRNTPESYPNPERSFYKYGLNAFLHYRDSDKVDIGFCVGTQRSEAQKIFGSGLGPITTAASATQYLDLKGIIRDFSFSASHNWGTQEPVLGQRNWKWDLKTTDVVVEYNYNRIKNLSIRPGIMYRVAMYDDRKYINAALNEGLFSGEAKTETKAASLRFDYHMMEKKLRLIAAGRLDQFNYPDKLYFSYQLAGTYKINENNLVRIVNAKATRTPLLIDLFSKFDLRGSFPITSPSQTFLLQLRGNKDIRLLTANLTGLGYRSRVNDNVAIDIELYYNKARDFSDLVVQSASVDSTGPVSFTGLINIDNLTVQTRQYGFTFTFDYTAANWQIKPFITIQRTDLLDYSPYNNTATSYPTATNNFNPAVNNLYSNMGTRVRHLATPSVYGGAYVNYTANKKLNLNLNAYFFSEHTQLENSNLTYKDNSRGVQFIDNKVLLSATLQYKVLQQLTLMANFRNILDANAVEFYKADAPAFMMLGGAYFEL